MKTLIRLLIHACNGIFFCLCFFAGITFLTGSELYYDVTDSMEPAISEGSLVMVRKQAIYKEGDIVTFSVDYGGQALCVTHRIIDQAESAFVTKGDANERRDQDMVAQSQIQGRVVGVIPFLGWVCYGIKEYARYVVLYLIGNIILLCDKYFCEISYEKTIIAQDFVHGKILYIRGKK